MSLPRSVADILREHVTLEVESIDRMYLNAYVPGLQYESGVAAFFRKHRRQPFASSALMDPISKAFVAAIHAFAAAEKVPLITLEKGQRKDDVMAEHLTRFTAPEGVVFVGRAQEKTPVFRTEKRHNPSTGRPYPWLVRSTAMVNHFYVYAVDRDFGPFFLKFGTYFPYNAKLCLNGHAYVKRQLAQRGIAHEALDNGLLSCADPAGEQPEDHQRAEQGEHSRVEKPQRRHALPVDDDRPMHPLHRALADRTVVADPLDVQQTSIGLKADLPQGGEVRQPTTDREVPRVVDDGLGAECAPLLVVLLDPAVLVVDVERRDDPVRQHPRAEAAGRLPGDPPGEDQLHLIGAAQIQVLADDLLEEHAPGNRTIQHLRQTEFGLEDRELIAIAGPLIGGSEGVGQPAQPLAGERLDLLGRQPVTERLHPPRGFTARDLRQHVAPLLGLAPAALSPGRVTYDLRRLRLHGLIAREPKRHRYRVTDAGLRLALFLPRVWARTVRPGLATVLPDVAPNDLPLRRAFARMEEAMDDWCAQAKLVA